MTGKTFSYPLTIKEHHLDTFGHVNNATYLEILEEARWDILNQSNWGVKKIQETGIGPTILQINIRFVKELLLRDNIIIETQLISYEKKIGTLEHRIMVNNEIYCTAEFKIGLFDLKQRKLILPTPEWLKALGY